MQFFTKERFYQIIVAFVLFLALYLIVLKVLQLQDQILLLETQNELLDSAIHTIVIEQKDVENQIKKTKLYQNKLCDEVPSRLIIYTIITLLF
jgi:Tfp pilus assembly protein PilN